MTDAVIPTAVPRRAPLRLDPYWLMVMPAVALIVVFYIYPLVTVLTVSVGEPQPGLANYGVLLTSAPIHRVLALVRAEAARHGALIAGCEVVGLVPQAALLDAAEHALQLEGFSRDQVLELRLRRPPLSESAPIASLLDSVAAATPTPGGGKTLMIAEYIRAQIIDLLRWGVGTALSTTLIATVLLLLWLLGRAVDLRKLFGAGT